MRRGHESKESMPELWTSEDPKSGKAVITRQINAYSLLKDPFVVWVAHYCLLNLLTCWESSQLPYLQLQSQKKVAKCQSHGPSVGTHSLPPHSQPCACGPSVPSKVAFESSCLCSLDGAHPGGAWLGSQDACSCSQLCDLDVSFPVCKMGGLAPMISEVTPTLKSQLSGGGGSGRGRFGTNHLPCPRLYAEGQVLT